MTKQQRLDFANKTYAAAKAAADRVYVNTMLNAPDDAEGYERCERAASKREARALANAYDIYKTIIS